MTHNRDMRALHFFELRHSLTKILKVLPIVDTRLNYSQERILNSLRNLFIMGRSGTGKTTTILLRAFCQDIVYRAVLKQ